MFRELLVLLLCVGVVDACRPGTTCRILGPLDVKNIAFAVEHNLTTNLTGLPKPREIPKQVILDEAMIKHLNNDCHANEGALAFSTGYARACDWLLGEIGIRENKFSRQPVQAMEALYPSKNVSAVVPIEDGNYMKFNLSSHSFDILRGDGLVKDSSCILNYSDSYKYAYYNITYYDPVNENWHDVYFQPWPMIAFYRGTWDNVTYTKTGENRSLDNNDYYLRVYFR
jgi:hypothetical protein